MLRLLRSARSLCLVALLATLVVAGQQVHAVGPCHGHGESPAAAIHGPGGVQGDTPEDGQPGSPCAKPCAVCQGAIAVPPQAVASGASMRQVATRLRPGASALVEGQGPDGLTRPPRGPRAA